MIKFWRFLSVPIVVAVCVGLILVPAALPTAVSGNPANEWAYEIQDETVTKVALGSSFTVNITTVQLSDGESDGWEPYLRYNTTYLSVTAIDTPSTLPPPNGLAPDWYPVPGVYGLSNPGYNNTEGILYVGYSPKPRTPKLNETFWLATIHFDAKAVEGITYLNFTDGGPFATLKIVLGSTHLEKWSEFVNGTVIIGDVFNLAVTSNGCCPITVSGGRGTVAAYDSQSFIVPCSENVTLTADDSVPCCNFVNWTLDGGAPTTNPLTVSGMAPNSTPIAIASCSVPKYNLTMAVNGNGTANASGSNPRSCGEEVPINATADTGWRFVNWTTNGTIDEIADPSANSTTVRMDENKTVTANFVEQFTLTMAVNGNGNTTPPEGNYTYDNGTVVDITAIPDACWDFVNWTGGVADPNSTSTNVTVDANKTVIANFAQVNYTLNITVTGNGNVTINDTITPTSYPNSTSWVNCTVVNLTATPDDDWAFVNWTGDVAACNSTSTNITVDANKTVTANFGPQDFSASPRSLTFTTVEGENPPSQTLEICNTGNGTLNWSLEDNAAWLDESPKSGSLYEDPPNDCEDVRVSVNVAGMKAGDYSATITITGSTRMEVPVSLHIESAMEAMPVLPAGLSASALSISPQQVQPGQEVTISVNVANTGGKAGSYNAVLYINSVVESSQQVSVAAGTSKNVIFTVSKSEPGVYDVSVAGQSGQFEVVGGGWFGGELGTGGIIAIVVIVIALIVALFFILRGTRREI